MIDVQTGAVIALAVLMFVGIPVGIVALMRSVRAKRIRESAGFDVTPAGNARTRG
jgi:hypothetical protein